MFRKDQASKTKKQFQFDQTSINISGKKWSGEKSGQYYPILNTLCSDRIELIILLDIW